MNSPGKDLWHHAAISLDEANQGQLRFDRQKSIPTLDELQKLTKQAEDKCINERWQFTSPIKSNEKVILRDLFKKITTWVDTFIHIGDTAVQYDPGHAALPWAGVRLLLQLCCNR